MRLSLYTDYAFRLLIQLAINEPNTVAVSDVANGYGISKNHLMKIANDLARGGFLDAIRGRNGGFRLARPPVAINLGDVARHCERSSPLVECFDIRNNSCVITPACHLKSVLAEAETAFYEVLSRRSLADITVNRRDLSRLLDESATV